MARKRTIMPPLTARSRARSLRRAGALAAPLLASMVTAASASAQTSDVDPAYFIAVDPSGAGVEIPDTMYGIFFEDINFAADGGIYPELVQNRSFEYLPEDNASYTGMTAWTEVAENGGAGTVTIVNDEERLNERNRTYLQLDLASASGSYGVVNAGFHEGVALTAGASYEFSVWARTTAAGGTPLTIEVRDAAGAVTSMPLQITVSGDEWTKYSGLVQAGADTSTAELYVLAEGTGTLRLDMVSLFPTDTFRGHANGLRMDLAEKIAALNPKFVRFPGGCLVNTNSHYGYDEDSGWERRRSYQWKDTVGPVEERATNANFWGYNQSYGLGYFEYFQFSEDMGAMPVPVLPALVVGCGQNYATYDDDLLQQHIQDALDLIEFANGAVDTTWGGLRAEMGHPEPFGLTHLAVGNEENLPAEYFERFEAFRSAINGAYPDIIVIGNTGPDDAGGVFDQLWALNAAAGVDMIDEHYYNSPTWFLQNNARYDSYDRSGPQVFLGEYASLDNRLFNALAEAAFMTGLERNSDIVRMASYAPLLANVDTYQWHPDMIWFDNDESWGSPSYYMQRLFMNNVGDETVPTTASGAVVEPEPITGMIGLSTWATTAAYDDIVVTTPEGEVLFTEDFSAGADAWTPLAGRGTWEVIDGAFVQTDVAALDTLIAGPAVDATDYDISLTATKLSGAEGFLIGFGVQDALNFYWWNLGGWNNAIGAVEKAVGGGKESLIATGSVIETGVPYDLRIEVRGTAVSLYLDGVLWGSFNDDAVIEPFAQIITLDSESNELIVKVVNAQDSAAVTEVDLGDYAVESEAQMTVISGDPTAVNTRTEEAIVPVESVLSDVASVFTHEFPANSVTFLRIPLQSEDDGGTGGSDGGTGGSDGGTGGSDGGHGHGKGHGKHKGHNKHKHKHKSHGKNHAHKGWR